MAVPHGSGLHLDVDGNDISQYTTSVDWPRTADTAPTHGGGDSAKSYVGGMKDSTISAEGNWDPTVDGILDPLLGTSHTVIYGPDGNGSGDVKYSATAIMTEYNPPANVDDRVTWSASWQASGDRTRSTFT